MPKKVQPKKSLGLAVLRELMNEAGLTEAELARQVDLPQTTINSLLLGGTTDPRARTLKPIAEFFGVTIGQLCGFETLSSHRVAGTTNQTQAASWRAVPIIEWDHVKSWMFDRKKLTPANHKHWIITERLLSEQAFALKSLASMEPRFRKGSILIIDPKAEYKDGHYVVIALDGIHPTVRKIIIDGSDILLKTFDETQAAIKLTTKHVIYGTIVESRLDTYDI